MFRAVYVCVYAQGGRTGTVITSGCISPIALTEKHIYQIHNQYKFADINEIYISYILCFIYSMIINIIHLLIAILS